MQFFEGCRPQFYFHGGKLIKDGKTGRQYWKLNLVLTLVAEEVLRCDSILRNCYEAIETRSNRIEELKISGTVLEQTIEFFSLADHKAGVLRRGHCDLSELRMTRDEDMTELWVKVQIENGDELHQFVKDYVFQRLWVEFAPTQMSLPGGVLDAADRLTASLRSGEVDSMSISCDGGEVLTLTKEDAERIHKRLKKDRVN